MRVGIIGAISVVTLLLFVNLVVASNHCDKPTLEIRQLSSNPGAVEFQIDVDNYIRCLQGYTSFEIIDYESYIDFGDGTSATTFGNPITVSHTYAQADYSLRVEIQATELQQGEEDSVRLGDEILQYDISVTSAGTSLAGEPPENEPNPPNNPPSSTSSAQAALEDPVACADYDAFAIDRIEAEADSTVMVTRACHFGVYFHEELPVPGSPKRINITAYGENQ